MAVPGYTCPGKEIRVTDESRPIIIPGYKILNVKFIERVAMGSEKGAAGLWGLVSCQGDFYSSRVATFRALILRSPVSPLNMNQSLPLIKLVPNPISFINFVIRV